MRRAMNDRTRVLPPFAILVAISAIGPLSLNIFIPSMPGLQDEFGIPYGKAQLTLTLFLIGMAILLNVSQHASSANGGTQVLSMATAKPDA